MGPERGLERPFGILGGRGLERPFGSDILGGL